MFRSNSPILLLLSFALAAFLVSCTASMDKVAPGDEETVLGGGGAPGRLVGSGEVTIPNANLENRLKKKGASDVNSSLAGFQVNVDVYDEVNESRNGQGTRIVFQESSTGFTIGRTNGAGDNGTLDQVITSDAVIYGIGTDLKGNPANWTPSFENPGIWTVDKTILPDCIGSEFKAGKFPKLQNGGYGTSLDIRGGKIVAVRYSMDIRPNGWTIVGKDVGSWAQSTRVRLTLIDDHGKRINWVPNPWNSKLRRSKILFRLDDSKPFCDSYLNRFHPNGRYDFSPEEVAQLNAAIDQEGATKLQLEFFAYYQDPTTGIMPPQGTVPNRAVGPDGNIERLTLDLEGRRFK